MTTTNFPDSLLRRWETYRWDDANLSSEFGTTDVGDILRVIAGWVRQDRAAGVTVDPALDVERLREAAQAMVTWWDTPPYTYDDRDMIERIDALRAALAGEEKP